MARRFKQLEARRWVEGKSPSEIRRRASRIAKKLGIDTTGPVFRAMVGRKQTMPVDSQRLPQLMGEAMAPVLYALSQWGKGVSPFSSPQSTSADAVHIFDSVLDGSFQRNSRRIRFSKGRIERKLQQTASDIERIDPQVAKEVAKARHRLELAAGNTYRAFIQFLAAFAKLQDPQERAALLSAVKFLESVDLFDVFSTLIERILLSNLDDGLSRYEAIMEGVSSKVEAAFKKAKRPADRQTRLAESFGRTVSESVLRNAAGSTVTTATRILFDYFSGHTPEYTRRHIMPHLRALSRARKQWNKAYPT